MSPPGYAKARPEKSTNKIPEVDGAGQEWRAPAACVRSPPRPSPVKLFTVSEFGFSLSGWENDPATFRPEPSSLTARFWGGLLLQ